MARIPWERKTIISAAKTYRKLRAKERQRIKIEIDSPKTIQILAYIPMRIHEKYTKYMTAAYIIASN